MGLKIIAQVLQSMCFEHQALLPQMCASILNVNITVFFKVTNYKRDQLKRFVKSICTLVKSFCKVLNYVLFYIQQLFFQCLYCWMSFIHISIQALPIVNSSQNILEFDSAFTYKLHNKNVQIQIYGGLFLLQDNLKLITSITNAYKCLQMIIDTDDTDVTLQVN